MESMGKFRALLSVNLRAVLLSSSGSRGRGRRRMTGTGMLILIVILCLYLSGIYSFAFAAQLAPVGMLDLLLLLMPVLVVVMGTMYTVMGVQGVVFGGKDNDLMLALPVPAFELLLARVMALALENLVFSCMILLPAGLAYTVFGGGGGIGFWLRLLIGAVGLSLFPTVLALILGLGFCWVSSRFERGRALLRNLLYLVFFCGILLFALQANGLIVSLSEHAAGIEAHFSGWGVPFILFQRGVCGSVPELLGMLVLFLLIFLLVIWVFGRQYQSLLTALTVQSARSDYRLKRQNSIGQRRSLLKKEARRFFTSTMYLFNAGSGLILLLLGSGGILVKGRDIRLVFGQLGGAAPLTPMLALAGLFCLSVSAVSASSISLEGRSLWILKESPVDSHTVLSTKWIFQLLLTMPCILISTAAAVLGCGLTWWQGGALLAVLTAFALFHAPFGVYINLCFPKLDAPNDTVVVKQSAASLLGTFLPMLLPGLGVLLYGIWGGTWGEETVMWLFAVLELAAAMICIRLLNTSGVKLLHELN